MSDIDDIEQIPTKPMRGPVITSTITDRVPVIVEMDREQQNHIDPNGAKTTTTTNTPKRHIIVPLPNTNRIREGGNKFGGWVKCVHVAELIAH